MENSLKRRFPPKGKTVVLALIVIVLVLTITKGYLFLRHFMDDTGLTPTTVAKLLFNGGVTLKASDDRTNILVLGVGGADHTGDNLTDTMIILSIDGVHKTLAIVSIPRDIWSDTLKDKINSAYHYGEEKKKGGGYVLSKVIIEEVTGLPIHYAVLIDFGGFQKIIDLVGGVDVSVSRAFTDTQYPVLGKETDTCNGDRTLACRYETIHFEQGVQYMDGTTALKYVRSRHAEGEEGNDFARGRRQQEVLLALKQKLLKPKLWVSPERTKNLITALDRATDTDLNIGELATIGKIASSINTQDIKRISVESELYSPPQWWYGRYVLLPKVSFDSLHDFIKKQLQ